MNQAKPTIWVLEYQYAVQDLPKTLGTWHNEWKPSPNLVSFASKEAGSLMLADAKTQFEHVRLAKYVREAQ